MAAQDREREVACLRAFNRTYTSRLGLLNARLDDSPFSLSEARILYELAHRTDPTAAELSRAIGLDRAQISRTLKRFGLRGLIRTRSDPLNGRRQFLSLSKAGRAAFAALDRNTRSTVSSFLDGLSPSSRRRLLAAAIDIARTLEGEAGATVSLRDLRPGDLGWVTHRQGVLYAEEYGWNNEYEGLVARILADFQQNFEPQREAAWIAEIDGCVAGSVFLVRGDRPRVGKLRLLYVEPDARRRGVGKILVGACIERARQVGYERLELWTNSVLEAARRLYARAGFVKLEEAPHHSFGQDLIGETWSLDLKSSRPGVVTNPPV